MNRDLAAVVAQRFARDGFAAVTLLERRGNGRADLIDRAERATALPPAAFVSRHHEPVQQG